MSKYAVVRTDKLFGTDVRTELVSVRYQPSGTKTAVENGNVVKLGDLETGSREIYKGATPAANTPINEIVLIASPEILYDDAHRKLEEFRNEAGEIARGYRLHTHDIFSVTAEAFNAPTTADVGQVVELMAGTKLKNVTSLTSGSTKVGTIIDKNIVGSHTYYAIEVC